MNYNIKKQGFELFEILVFLLEWISFFNHLTLINS
jgi:hypothetical protein